MELSQASLLLDPAPCNWKPALNGCPTACCTWPAAPTCTTARARCSNGGSARVPARASTSGGTRGPRVQRLGRRQRRYARGLDPSGEEYFTGMPAVDLAIQFRDAAEFFGAEAYRAARDSGAISAAVCGRVGMGATPQRLPTGEVLGGRLLHIGRDTKWGWRCAATSTWARTWSPTAGRRTSSGGIQRRLRPRAAHALLQRVHLPVALPARHLRRRQPRRQAGDAALVSAAPQATDTRRIPSPPGHGVPRTVDPKQGLEYAVAKAAHHGQRPHRPEAVGPAARAMPGALLQPDACVAEHAHPGAERAAGVGLAPSRGPRTS